MSRTKPTYTSAEKPTATYIMGAPGSGKNTIVERILRVKNNNHNNGNNNHNNTMIIDRDQFMFDNPEYAKEITRAMEIEGMSEENLIPTNRLRAVYRKYYEQANLELAQAIRNAIAKKYNFVTFVPPATLDRAQIKDLKKKDYTIHIYFVDTNLVTAFRRAQERSKSTKLIVTIGDLIESQQKSWSEFFENCKQSKVDQCTICDNNGPMPICRNTWQPMKNQLTSQASIPELQQLIIPSNLRQSTEYASYSGEEE